LNLIRVMPAKGRKLLVEPAPQESAAARIARVNGATAKERPMNKPLSEADFATPKVTTGPIAGSRKIYSTPEEALRDREKCGDPLNLIRVMPAKGRKLLPNPAPQPQSGPHPEEAAQRPSRRMNRNPRASRRAFRAARHEEKLTRSRR
jgi:hypothetical protein